jgi:hypothetical protein
MDDRLPAAKGVLWMTDYVERSKHLGLAGSADRKPWIVLALVGALLTCAPEAWSAPVYIGLQETGVNGGAITQEATGGGTASITNLVYGNSTDGNFELSVSATGTPPSPEPFLNSDAMVATASFPGIIAVYVTETNQFPVGFSDFYSIFGVKSIGAGITVTESTYIHECSPPVSACNTTIGAGGDVFATTTLLSSQTFTSTGSVIDFTANGLPLPTNSDYAVTEVYTLDFTQTITSVNATIDVKVPEPMSISLLGGALLGIGMVRRRRAN